MVTSSMRSPFFAVVGFSTIVAAGILTVPAVAAARGSCRRPGPESLRRIG